MKISKESLKNIFSYQNFVLAVFCFLIASIPLFSFNAKLSILTWGIAIVLFGMMGIWFLVKKKFSFDFVNIALILFGVLCVVSSLVNGMRGFNFTPILMCLSMAIIYSYCKASGSGKKMLFSAWISVIIFLLVFLFKYRSQIISLDFSTRFGGVFGDENDVAFLLAFGLAMSVYVFFFKGKILMKVASAVLSVLFFGAGFLTASKIFIFLSFFAFLICLFAYFGKKHWWISLLVLAGLALIILVLFLLPPFESIRRRFVMFFTTLFTDNSGSMNSQNDISTVLRFDMFLAGLEMFLRKPLFGYGVWGFATYGGINNGWSHNHISEGLCNFGILGFAAFHIPFIYCSSKLFKNRKSANKNDALLFILLIGFFLVTGISIPLYTQKLFAFLSGPVLAIVEVNDVLAFKFKKKEVQLACE